MFKRGSTVIPEIRAGVGSREALLIASSRYNDERLQQLRSPGGDAVALADVLREHGDFEVRHPVLNEPHHVILREIDAFFSKRSKDDLLLLYLSCHGVLYDDGQLYYATSNTDLPYPRSTAVPAQSVNDFMRTTAAQSTVLLLDCCHSGAAARGMVAKATGDVHLEDRLGGRGRIILTASRDTEYAFEGEDLSGEGRGSVFTRAFVEGIRTREADTNGDGVITLQDIYEYVARRVHEKTPHQTPTKWGLEEQGELIIATFKLPATPVEQAPAAPRDKARWRSDALGPAKQLTLARGTLRYHETGRGPGVLFVHGAMVNANVWRKVIPALASDFRCITLDLPFGAHVAAMPREMDFSPPGLADWISDAIEALHLDDVTLVGNHTGGALCQLIIARRPEGIGRLVLTSCDAFENFPPKALPANVRAMLFPVATSALCHVFRLGIARRNATTLLGMTKRPVDVEAADSYSRPLLSADIRNDAKRLRLEMDRRHTVEAAKGFSRFHRPALVAWSHQDKLFPRQHAERLADALPNGRLEWVDDAYTLSAEDQPDRLAELIARFIRETAAQNVPSSK